MNSNSETRVGKAIEVKKMAIYRKLASRPSSKLIVNMFDLCTS